MADEKEPIKFTRSETVFQNRPLDVDKGDDPFVELPGAPPLMLFGCPITFTDKPPTLTNIVLAPLTWPEPLTVEVVPKPGWSDTETIRVWQDLRWFAVAELKGDHWCDFKVYELADITANGPVADKKDSHSSPNPATTLEESQVAFHGFIKWDGCSQWWFDDEPLHLCGWEAVRDFGTLFDNLFKWAAEIIPNWDGDVAEMKG